MAKQRSTTKAGPGRLHKDGHKKASPIKARGAPLGFQQRTADAAKRLRRANIKALGRRQAIKAAKRERRETLSVGLAA